MDGAVEVASQTKTKRVRWWDTRLKFKPQPPASLESKSHTQPAQDDAAVNSVFTLDHHQNTSFSILNTYTSCTDLLLISAFQTDPSFRYLAHPIGSLDLNTTHLLAPTFSPTIFNMSQDPRLLLQKAEKAAQGASGGFSFFGSKTDKWENTADLFTQAANAFRLQKQNHEAGRALEQAASIQQTKLSEPDDMANTLTEAFKVYRKDSPTDAARVLTQAISHYTSRGNFRRAATHQQNLAEVYEMEIGDQKKALEAYDTAAQWFESDNAEALANKLFLKVADLAALEGDYPRAIDKFEAVARSSINSNLMKWSVKDYFLKAGICHLAAGDSVATKRALDNYREMDNSFGQTRENMLLTDLVGCVEEADQEAFADKLFQFDQLSKLDKWKTTLLLRVKNGISEKEEDFS